MRRGLAGSLAVAAIAAVAGGASAAPSGAAFTTTADGAAVDANLYDAPADVFLNGGPGCGAPRHAAALADGDYVFRVTTTSGRTVLSERSLAERTFTVSDGVVIASSAPTSDHLCSEGLLVQVGPFARSPNGVYKLWIAPARTGDAFPRRRSRTDDFRVDPSGFATPPTDPPPEL